MSKHREIYQHLRRGVLDGRYAAGEKLPSTRLLAVELGCARNTVVQAFELLAAHGLIETRHGAGSFVAGGAAPAAPTRPGAEPPAPTDAAQRAVHAYRERRQRDAARLSAPVADFQYGSVQVDAAFRRVWQSAVAQAGRALATEYQLPEGDPRLRRALADYLRRRRGMRVDPERILVTSGSQQALDLVARATLAPGREAVIEDPCYPGARGVFEASGAHLRPVPVDAQGLRVDALPARADLVYVTPSHQFPSGAILPMGRRLQLLEWARQGASFVFEDDYDSEFRHHGPPLETLQSLDRDGRVIYCGTLSKILSPALRMGYLVLPEALVERVRALKWITDRASGQLEQLALAALIEEGHLERLIRRNGRRLARRCEALVRGLNERFGGHVAVSGSHTGLHLMAAWPCLTPAQADALVTRAAAVGVGVYSNAPYYLAAPRPAGVLMGYATLSLAQIETGLDLLREAWAPVLD